MGRRKHARYIFADPGTHEFHNTLRGFGYNAYLCSLPPLLLRCVRSSLEKDAPDKIEKVKSEQARIAQDFSNIVEGLRAKTYSRTVRTRIKHTLEDNLTNMAAPKYNPLSLSSPEQLIHVVRFLQKNSSSTVNKIVTFVEQNSFALSNITDEDLQDVASSVIVKSVMAT
jgi:hypothetical protein